MPAAALLAQHPCGPPGPRSRRPARRRTPPRRRGAGRRAAGGSGTTSSASSPMQSVARPSTSSRTSLRKMPNAPEMISSPPSAGPAGAADQERPEVLRHLDARRASRAGIRRSVRRGPARRASRWPPGPLPRRRPPARGRRRTGRETSSSARGSSSESASTMQTSSLRAWLIPAFERVGLAAVALARPAPGCGAAPATQVLAAPRPWWGCGHPAPAGTSTMSNSSMTFGDRVVASTRRRSRRPRSRGSAARSSPAPTARCVADSL